MEYTMHFANAFTNPRAKMDPYKLNVCGCISRSCNCSHRNGGDYWCSQYLCQYSDPIKQRKGVSSKRKTKAKVKHKQEKTPIPLVVQQREAQAKVMEDLKRKWAAEKRENARLGQLNYSRLDFDTIDNSRLDYDTVTCQVQLDPRYQWECPHNVEILGSCSARGYCTR